MKKILRFLFFFIAKAVIYLVLGLRVYNKAGMPKSGPAIIVANHNSHLDTLVLMTLFPCNSLEKLRPVAAEDYFLKNAFLAWFSLYIIGIIPLKRQCLTSCKDPFKDCSQALENGEILIIYPEGSRGKPESLSDFKSGIAHLAKRHPDIPIYPVFLQGLGKALPKGEHLLVPFLCNVLIGEPIYWTGHKKEFMELLNQRMQVLITQENFLAWE